MIGSLQPIPWMYCYNPIECLFQPGVILQQDGRGNCLFQFDQVVDGFPASAFWVRVEELAVPVPPECI